ncbi:MAG: UDP-N-acetylmuramoyl-L-alanine--D-glutamate ligase [Bacilli bacterium]
MPSSEVFLLLGYGKSNRALANLLKKRGIPHSVYDDYLPEKSSAVDLNPFTAIVKSGGIKNDHFLLEEARKLNKRIISDLELFYSWNKEKTLITVTGTNGKTTTVQLIKHLLPELDLAGNVGSPLFDHADSEKDMVIEASSFMLEYTHVFRSRINVFLNISPNHLDHHGSFAGDLEAKLKLLKNSRPEDFLVYNADDSVLEKALRGVGLRKIPFSRKRRGGIFISERGIDCFGKMIDLAGIKLMGKHNLENIAAALGAVLAYDPAFSAFSRLHAFTPLPHRLEYLGKIGSMLVYNDSKATNYRALGTALAAFSGKRVLLIAGGEKRAEDPAVLDGVLDTLVGVLLNGENGKTLQDYFKTKGVRTWIYRDLASLFKEINNHLNAQDVLLFSPGSASHDQFRNFEERGEFFKKNIGAYLTE